MVRTMRATFAAVVAATLLGACGGGAPGGGGGGPVSFQFFGDAEEAVVYERIAAAFTRKTGTRVNVVAVPDRDTHLAKLTTAFAAGQAPDVFLLNYRNFGSYESRGVLEPVDARIEASAAFARDDFYPSSLDAFTADEKVQCLPQNASSLVVYYNQALFEDAGLRPPAKDWTYRDFMAAARKLRDVLKRTDPKASAVGVDPGLIRLAPFIWSAGGELADDIRKPERFTFDTPGARTGIGRFLAIYREGLTPTEAGVEAQGLDERFFNGQLGMFMSSRDEVPGFRSIERFEWDVAAFPGAERPASVLQSDGLCLAKGDKADKAWRFAEFAAGPEGQRALAEAGYIVPSLRPVAESSTFLDPAAAPRSDRVFLEGMTGLRRLPNTREWPRIEDAASLAFKRAFYDELSVQAAIVRIEAETRGLF